MDTSTNEIIHDIDRMFSDTSVSKEVAKDRLDEIIEHCQMLKESL